jgi:ankyrin repeat protein
MKDNKGLTPLLTAAYYGNWSMMEYLLQCGASIKAATPKGNILHYIINTKSYKLYHWPNNKHLNKIWVVVKIINNV